MLGCLGVGVVCVCVCVDQEPIVQHDVMDGVQFFFVFVILQVLSVQLACVGVGSSRNMG